MRKQKKIWMPGLMLGIGLLLMTLMQGCGRNKEFIVREGLDRAWLSKGQDFKVPESGVYLSDRMFKYYAKGCPDA